MVNYKKCCYKGCTNNSKLSSVGFVTFPKPKTKYLKCKKWITACGRTDLTTDLIKKHHYVCFKHFPGGLGPTERCPDPDSFNDTGCSVLNVRSISLPKDGKDNAIDLSVLKANDISVAGTPNAMPRNKYNLYSVKNSDKNDFNETFFHDHIEELIARCSKSMASCNMISSDVIVKDVIENIIKNPDEIKITDDTIKLLTVLNDYQIRDKYAFLVHTQELRGKKEFKDAILNSFATVKGFNDLLLFKQHIIVNNWLRRFFVTLQVKWVELKPAANELKPKKFIDPKFLNDKHLKDKEDKVVHHLGGYILKKISRKFDEPHLMESCIAEEGEKPHEYSLWSERLTRGGLLVLKSRAFEFFLLIKSITAPIFEQSILKDNSNRKENVINALKSKSVIDRWNYLWGSGNEKNREKCFNIVIDTFCNCRGKAMKDFYKRKVNKINSDTLSQKKGCRKALKESNQN